MQKKTKQVDRHKISVGQLNDVELQKNQGETAERESGRSHPVLEAAPEEKARQVMRKTQRLAKKKHASHARGATAKTLAARKAASKK